MYYVFMQEQAHLGSSSNPFRLPEHFSETRVRLWRKSLRWWRIFFRYHSTPVQKKKRGGFPEGRRRILTSWNDGPCCDCTDTAAAVGHTFPTLSKVRFFMHNCCKYFCRTIAGAARCARARQRWPYKNTNGKIFQNLAKSNIKIHI